jgi:LPXTG-motif cell wall-anchored protein
MHVSNRLCRAFTPTLVLASVASLTLPAGIAWGPSVATAQEGEPDLQLPFECGTTWQFNTWAHAPALDMVRDPTQDGTEGAVLLAPADGTIEQSFRHDNAGNVVQIDHGNGWFTTYLHMQDRSVDVGDTVSRGDEIGHVGRDGPTANDHPHLHFELAFDEDGSGDASWGFEGAERVRPTFNGTEYGQSDGDQWDDVESHNCDEPEPPPTTEPPAPPSTEPPSTTAPPPPSTEPPTTAAPTTEAPTPSSTTTSTVPPTSTTEPAEGGTLPLTGSSGTTITGIVGAALLGAGIILVRLRRRIAARA